MSPLSYVVFVFNVIQQKEDDIRSEKIQEKHDEQG